MAIKLESKTILVFLLILAIASFFRLWQLSSIPPGLYPDVAINGNEAIDSLKSGNFKVFYPENNGREGLFIWLIALSYSIFGVSIWSIKIVAAIVGILTVLGLYLLTKEFFDKNVALLSSFFLAVSFWHTNFSRIGFRAILLPFILVFSFYFLLKFLNHLKFKNQFQKRLYGLVVLAGIFFGLGFYTYTSFRMAVLILPFVFLPYWFLSKKQNLEKQFLASIFYFLFFAFIIALPLGIYFLQNPHDFISRAAPISIFSAENPLKEFGKSLVLHLGMFNFYGDRNWRHNFSGSSMLFWPIGILFLIGFILSIKKLINFRKHKNLSLVISHWSLVTWFFIMLLPGILTSEGIPHALRTIGVIPVVYIFAGLGGWEIYKWFDKNVENKKLLSVTALFFLFTVAFLQFDKYFIKWSNLPEVEGAFSKNYVEIGNYLNSLPFGIQKYVIVNQPGVPVPYPDGIPMPAQTIMFVENAKFGKPQSTYLLSENLDKIKINDEKTVIVPMRYDKDLFNELLQRFPEGKIQKREGFWVYKINF